MSDYKYMGGLGNRQSKTVTAWSTYVLPDGKLMNFRWYEIWVSDKEVRNCSLNILSPLKRSV